MADIRPSECWVQRPVHLLPVPITCVLGASREEEVGGFCCTAYPTTIPGTSNAWPVSSL